MKQWWTCAVVMALSLASCGVTEIDSKGLLRERLEAARTQWRNEGYTDYTIVLRRSCTNCQGGTEPAAVIVRDGARVSATFVETGQPVPPGELPLYFTVNELFDFVEEAINADADEMIVSYNPLLGYPSSIFVDFVTETLNEEMAYTVTSVESQ
jgi:hypothetical protein